MKQKRIHYSENAPMCVHWSTSSLIFEIQGFDDLVQGKCDQSEWKSFYEGLVCGNNDTDYRYFLTKTI